MNERPTTEARLPPDPPPSSDPEVPPRVPDPRDAPREARPETLAENTEVTGLDENGTDEDGNEP